LIEHGLTSAPTQLSIRALHYCWRWANFCRVNKHQKSRRNDHKIQIL